MTVNIHSHLEAVKEPMPFEKFQARRRLLRKNNDNPALRYFNRLDDDFKFAVLTLANREKPATFKLDEVGKQFEEFDEARRLLIIGAMNRISRWGKMLPRYLSAADCALTE